MALFKKYITVVTHSGGFHADEVFGCAALSLWAEKNKKSIQILRTRDQDKINAADIVLDVGGVYHPAENRYDHHQKEGAGFHEINKNIPYASFGLIWKHYGAEICGKEIAAVVEAKLVLPIDARDNGINISAPATNKFGVAEYRITNAINAFRPVDGSFADFNKKFNEALKFAREIIAGEMAFADAEIEGEKKVVVQISHQDDPDILIFEERLEWEKPVSKNENTKIVVYPDGNGRDWKAEAVRNDLEDYTTGRVSFPEKWRGLRGLELEKISGIKGAIFCHRGGFVAVAKTKDIAIEMAKAAMANK